MSFVAHVGNIMFGMYQLKYNKEWDEALNILLDKHSKHAVLETHTITLGEYEVWVSNKWYCYGNLHRAKGLFIDSNYRPSIFTMQRLDRLVSSIKASRKKEKAEKEKQQFMSVIENIENKA